MTVGDPLRYCPVDGFFDKNGVCAMKYKFLQATAATAAQALVTAVTAKRLRLLELIIHSNGAAGSNVFYSASAGTVIGAVYVPANTVATPNVILEFNPFGYFETTAGQGLYMDNNSAATTNVTLGYIEYTP